LFSQKRKRGKVLILADPDTVAMMALSLKRHGMQGLSQVDIETIDWKGMEGRELFKEITVIVSFGRKYAEFLNVEHVEFLKDGIDIYSARPDAFPTQFWESAIAGGFSTYRIDSRVGFAAELNLAIETKKLVGTMGRTEIAGISMVSGGCIGYCGSVVIDSIINPTRVIGIADGLGGVLPPEEEHAYSDSLEKIRGLFLERLYI
jgi:hypothetical protein